MDEQQKTPVTYKVPEKNLAQLQERITRLQRRAKKLGSGEIVLNILGHTELAEYIPVDGEGRPIYLKMDSPVIPLGYTFSGFMKRIHDVQVTGDRPRLAEATFVGSLDAITDEDGKYVGNMLRVVPGHEGDVPTYFRDAQMNCDHCKKQRNWRQTFIVKKGGEYFQVGRQCIKDFVGHASPEMFAAWAELEMNIGDLLSESEDGSFGGERVKERYGVQWILTRVATIIRLDGWKNSKFEEQSTANTLRHGLWAKNADLKDYEARYQVEDADKKLAEETLEWLEGLSEQEDLNDYLYNLSVLGRAGSVEPKGFGVLASAIATFQRTRDIELYRKEEKRISEHVGTKGKRQEFTLTLRMKRYFESSFGTKTLCKFHDENGNVIVWWASAEFDYEDGSKIKAKATVKNHEVYNEIKQTSVQRLAVTEELELPLSKAEMLQQAEKQAESNAIWMMHSDRELTEEAALAKAKQEPSYLGLLARVEKCTQE